MIGVVFEGGGCKGSYQIGAYYALKRCGIKPDAIVGSSIGSFNAAMIASGKEKELLNFWKKAEVGKLFGFSDQYIDSINNDATFFEKAYYAQKEFMNALKNKGIRVDDLKGYLVHNIDEKVIRKNKMQFGLNTVRLKDLKPLYLFKEDIPEGKIIDYIMASCYLPVFQMTKLGNDNEYFIDGGFYDKSPSIMLENKGYDIIYVIGLKGVGFRKKKLNKSNIITIEPSKNLGSTLNVNKKEIKYNIKLGFYDTMKKLKNLDGYKYIFKVKEKSFYNRIIKGVEKNELLHLQNFFFTLDNKELIIKAIEYVLKEEKKEYTKIYDPFWQIVRIKFLKRSGFVYSFIKDLKLF